MVTRAGYRNYVAYEWEDLTQETVASGAPFQFGDDFIGAGHTAGIPAAGSPSAGYPWVKKLVGTPTGVALVTNSSGGIMQCALAATSEAEEASLYFNDSLSVDTTKTGQAEWRAALATPPSAAGVQAAIGLGTAWVGGPQSLARYMLFGWTANNSLLIWSKDGVGSTISQTAVPIGSTALATDTNMHVYRIDWSNPTDLAFYVDGTRVNTIGSITWQATGTNAILQPWHTVYKPSGTGVATLNVDKIDIFNGR